MNSPTLLRIAVVALAILLPFRRATAEDTALPGKVNAAIDKGLAYLGQQQKPEGFWSSADYPGLSGLCVQAFLLAPGGKHRTDDAARRGLAFVRKNARPDGGIYAGRMGIYNTSVCLATLLRAGDPADSAMIEAAHQYLVGGQTKNAASPANDGGFGYEAAGSGRQTRPDLDNTVFVLEALRLYRDTHPGKESPSAGPQLNWQAALDFVSRCQQMPNSNPAGSPETSPEDKGGFAYTPGGSTDRGAAGEKGPRSYGTMTYAGVLSFIYADMKKDDPRIVSAFDWISRHYTLEENPGQGAQGLYYYYQMMSKGLTVAGINQLSVGDGKKVNWRADLATKLLSLQKPDGSWSSENGRWMEKDPNLVTTYCLLALNFLNDGL
jgi:squalene-hopene/tetraprenyl-beta-curcumene cyclase